MGKKRQLKARALVSLDELTSEEIEKLRRSTEKWRKKFAGRKRAIRKSSRITAADLSIRINARQKR